MLNYDRAVENTVKANGMHFYKMKDYPTVIQGSCKVARSKSNLRVLGRRECLQRSYQGADLIKEFKRFPTARKANNKPASRKAIFILARSLLDSGCCRGSNRVTCLKRMLWYQ